MTVLMQMSENRNDMRKKFRQLSRTVLITFSVKKLFIYKTENVKISCDSFGDVISDIQIELRR